MLAHDHDTVRIRHFAEQHTSVVTTEVCTFDGQDFRIVPVEATFNTVYGEAIWPFYVVVYDSASVILRFIRKEIYISTYV